ncbi:hypothetical protein SD81_027705 [Tolypothrix campylonemoides VB511288]|nr:hypothetical protein SD81_027705 [Tolypothrix campylonemoides VB511288]
MIHSIVRASLEPYLYARVGDEEDTCLWKEVEAVPRRDSKLPLGSRGQLQGGASAPGGFPSAGDWRWFPSGANCPSCPCKMSVWY